MKSRSEVVFAAMRGLSAPAHRGVLHRRGTRTSKQAVCAALCAVTELGDVSGAQQLSCQACWQQNHSWRLPCSLRCNESPLWECDGSLCCTAHPFFLISSSSVKLSNLTDRLCVCDGEGDLEGSLMATWIEHIYIHIGCLAGVALLCTAAAALSGSALHHVAMGGAV